MLRLIFCMQLEMLGGKVVLTKPKKEVKYWPNICKIINLLQLKIKHGPPRKCKKNNHNSFKTILLNSFKRNQKSNFYREYSVGTMELGRVKLFDHPSDWDTCPPPLNAVPGLMVQLERSKIIDNK